MNSPTIHAILRKEAASGKLRTRAQVRDRSGELRLQEALSHSDLPWRKLADHPVSLLMILHKCHEYYEFCEEISEVCEMLARRKIVLKESVLSVVDKARNILLGLGDVDAAAIKSVEEVGEICDVTGVYPINLVHNELLKIRETVRFELQRRKFLYVPAPDDARVGEEQPFGEQVYRAFPSARKDVTDAGTAFAMELYTACVFHLMRAVEYGIRALAWDRRVKTLTKSGKSYPLDLATWEDILRELDDQVTKISQWPRTKGEIRTQATEFYGTAVQEIRGFKDTWRNHVMHTRGEYTREDAVQVMSHVKRFLVTLAARISEQDRTPYVWTKKQIV